jgi:hypothetical protein
VDKEGKIQSHKKRKIDVPLELVMDNDDGDDDDEKPGRLRSC